MKLITSSVLLSAALLMMPLPVSAASVTIGGRLDGVVSRDGAPIKGATVRVVAWPNPSILAAMPAGTPVPLLLVGQAKTDRQGHFAVSPAAVPADYRDADGFTNYEIAAATGRLNLTWHMPLAFTTPGKASPTWSAPRYAQAKTPHPVSLRFDLGTDSGVDVADDPVAAWSGMNPANVTARGLMRVPTTSASQAPSVALRRVPSRDATSAAVVAAVRPNFACSWAPTNNWYYNQQEKFMAAYGYTGARVKVKETNSANHELGIGFKNTSGQWSQNGSLKLKESSGNGAEIAGFYDDYIYNGVNYRDFIGSCGGTLREAVSTYGFVSSTSYAGHYYWSACLTYSSGTVWKSQGLNITYGGGVDIGPINVSAQAGWDVNTEEAWVFTRKSALCGSTAQGWASSPQAEAHLQN